MKPVLTVEEVCSQELTETYRHAYVEQTAGIVPKLGENEASYRECVTKSEVKRVHKAR